MQLLLFALLALPVSFLMSQLKSMTELVVYMVAYLGTPEYCEDIVNPKFLNFFEGGWGEVFLFFTSDLEEVGGSIGSGFPPGYFLIGAGESQTPDVEGCGDVDAATPLRYFLLATGDLLTDDVEGIAGVGGGMVTQGVEG